MSTTIISCAEALRPVSLSRLTYSLELLEERITEILRLTSGSPTREASFQIGTAAARAEVNLDQLRRHLGDMGIALPETIEPDVSTIGDYPQ